MEAAVEWSTASGCQGAIAVNGDGSAGGNSGAKKVEEEADDQSRRVLWSAFVGGRPTREPTIKSVNIALRNSQYL